MPISENFERVKKQVWEACQKTGRDPKEVRIVSVSKNRTEEDIIEAFGAGARDFGENKVQEMEGKKYPKSGSGINGAVTMHFIGRLQANKAKACVGLADYIHSIDTLELARKVDAECLRQGKRVKVLVQVNVTGESTKSGVRPFGALQMAEEMVAQMKGLELLGLMTMAEKASGSTGNAETGKAEEARPAFKQLKSLLSLVNAKLGLSLGELSMGMSQDFQVAVEEGATIIRVGSAIFE